MCELKPECQQQQWWPSQSRPTTLSCVTPCRTGRWWRPTLTFSKGHMYSHTLTCKTTELCVLLVKKRVFPVFEACKWEERPISLHPSDTFIIWASSSSTSDLSIRKRERGEWLIHRYKQTDVQKRSNLFDWKCNIGSLDVKDAVSPDSSTTWIYSLECFFKLLF